MYLGIDKSRVKESVKLYKLCADKQRSKTKRCLVIYEYIWHELNLFFLFIIIIVTICSTLFFDLRFIALLFYCK